MFVSLLRTTPLLYEQALALAAADDGSDFLVSLAWGAVVLFVGLGAVWLIAKVVQSPASSPPSSRRSVPPPSSRRSVPPPSSRRAESMPPASSRRPVTAESAPASSRRPSAAPASVRPIPRRVIRLHAETPGQSCHEYNVGDNYGTRGSALVRVA